MHCTNSFCDSVSVWQPLADFGNVLKGLPTIKTARTVVQSQAGLTSMLDKLSSMVTVRSARWGWIWVGPAALTILAMVSSAMPRTSATWLLTPTNGQEEY